MLEVTLLFKNIPFFSKSIFFFQVFRSELNIIDGFGENVTPTNTYLQHKMNIKRVI